MAIREKELAPAKIRCAEVVKDTDAGSIQSMARAEDNPIAILMDAPMASMTSSKRS